MLSAIINSLPPAVSNIDDSYIFVMHYLFYSHLLYHKNEVSEWVEFNASPDTI